MKTNPYKRLLKGCAAAGILLDVANSDTSDFKNFAAELDGDDITKIGMITSRQIRKSGVEAVLVIGFLLDLYSQLTVKEKELYDNMLADCDIGRTQSYRSINSWRKLGRDLVKSPKLLRKFVPEGLKILCEAKVPDAARDEALSLAAMGNRITIKLAEEICSRHCGAITSDKHLVASALPPKDAPPIKKKPAPKVESPKVQRSLISFAGAAFRFVVETKTSKLKEVSKSVLADVIEDAKRFVADLEDQYAAMAGSDKLTKVG